MLEDASRAFRASAQTFLTGKIDFLARFRISTILLAEIKLGCIFVIQANDGVERTPHLVAEAIQRADRAFGQQGFHFGGFELTSGNDLP